MACAPLMAAVLAGCGQTEGTPKPAPTPTPTLSRAETAAGLVKTSMQQKFDTDKDLSQFDLQVVDVALVNKAGNGYKGMATVRTKKGAEHDVSIDVTYDGDNILWEAPPGAFLFALDDPPPAAAPPPTPAPPAAAPPAATVLRPSRNGGMVYIATKSGKTRCQIRSTEIDCQAPFTNTPYIDGYHASGITFRSDGSYTWVLGDLGDIPVVTLDYRTYRALSWTIDAQYNGTRFTHDNGRTTFISIDSVQFG